MLNLKNSTKFVTLLIGTIVILSMWVTSVNAQLQQLNCNSAKTNMEIKECIRLRYEAADRQLNQVYKELILKLSSEERSLLVEAQRGWIQLRDKNCEFEVYRSRRGTGYRGFLNECLERMTKQRKAELENYLKDR